MADIEGGLVDGSRQEIAAPGAGSTLKRMIVKVYSFRPNFNQNYHLHPILENMRTQEIGKVVLNMMVPVFALAAAIFFNIDDPNKTAFGFILLVLFAGGLAIFNGLLLRDTYRWLACVLEVLGIVLVFLSVTGLVVFLVSGLFLVIPVFCAVFVLLPFIIATLPRDEPVLHLEN